MTTYIPDANVTATTGDAFSLAAGDRIYIGQGIQVASTDPLAFGINGFFGNNLINIDGTVAATIGVSLNSNSTLTIGRTGRISAFDAGVYSAFSGGIIYNDGAIYSDAIGVLHSGGAIAELHNSGSIVSGLRIVAANNAAIWNATADPTYTENSGLIQARKAGSFSFLATNIAADTLINTGHMIGAIKFGGGNDFYDGAAGRLAGRLFGDAGNDTAVGGIDNDWFEGGADNDILRGNGGNDRLDGGAGNDQLFGDIGNDSYFVDNANDIVSEAGGNGIDTVFSSITFNLGNAARVIGAVENLTLVGPGVANGFGNSLNNVITGNNFNNTLNGLGGNDTLLGNAGNDILIGGAGNDILIGGLGRDMLSGGAGNDIFRFAAATHSLVGNPDIITDFDDSGNDRIDVSALFGPAMTYRHNGAFTAAGQVRISDIAGPDVIVQVNTGGSLAADFAIRLTGTTLGSMTASDFFL